MEELYVLSCKILNSLFSRVVVKVSDFSDLVQVFRAMYKYRIENRRCFQILMRTRSTYNAASNDSKSDTQIGLSVLREISNSCNSIGKDLKRRVNSSGKMPQAKVRKTRSKTGFKDSDEAVETNQNLEVSKSEEKFKATTEIASKIKIENVAEDNETGDKVDRFEENNKTKQIGDLKQSKDDVSQQKKTGKAKRKSSEFVKEEVKVEESENDTETKSKVVKIRNKRAKRGEIESSEEPQSNKSGKNPQTGGRIENIKIKKVEAIERTEDEIQSSERVSRKSKISAAKNIEKSAKLEEKQIKSEYFSDSDYEEKEKVVIKREADVDMLNESSLDSETEYLPKKKKKSEQKVKVKSVSGEINSNSAPRSSKTGAGNKQNYSKDQDNAKNKKTGKAKSKKTKTSAVAGDDSNSDDEWEEIPGVNNKTDLMKKFSQMQSSQQDVTIVIEKDKNEAFMNWVGQIYRKHRKWQQIGVHKAYLMCCCAAGRYRNDICNSPLLQSLLYSLIPSEHLSKSKNSWNVESVKNFDSWFGKKFSFKDNSFGNKQVTIESLAKCIESKQCEFYTEYVMVFVCALRSLGFQCRLVWNLTRLPAVKKLGEMTEHEKKLADKILAEREKAKKIQADKLEDNQVNTGIKIENGVDKKEPLDDSSDLDSTGDSENVAAAPMIQQNNTEDDIRALLMQTENYNPNNLISSDLKLSQETTSSYFNENIVKVGKKGAKGLKKSSNAKGDKGKIAKQKNEKDYSSHSDSEAEEIQDSGVNFWVEVYLKKEAHWVCVSPVDKIYNKSYVIEKQAWKPVSYVFAFDNYNRMKDVTKRYALRWGSVNQKTRVEWIGKAEGKSWYESFCQIFAPLDKNFEAKEDVQIRDQMAHMPIPGTVAELKDHPLYVLERHLLKFEVLHPKTAPVLGYVRSEPVFSRKCVNICHTEQTWMKEGMSVKKGEEAVKFVKPLISKFKLRKLEREGQEVEMVGLYGGWQVELYKAPPVIDGRIPRNHYGNVELFKMHMLPPGSVFLDLPGLDKVAKELDVDCVSAMRGWDFSGCHARPVLEGFVVCAENEQLLRECWQEKKREAESKVRESRAVGNWKRIVRALRISQIIKRKYEYSNEPELTSRPAATSNSLDDFEEL